MYIKHNFDNNMLSDLYSKHSSRLEHGFATTSFPFEVKELPDNTRSLAFVLADKDAIPVCGFEYIHWVVANVPAKQSVIPEDFARKSSGHLKGSNSLTSKFLSGDFGNLTTSYIGPCPPDKNHLYTLTVYALDMMLDLPEGFFLNQLHHAMKNHILATAHEDFIGRV